MTIKEKLSELLEGISFFFLAPLIMLDAILHHAYMKVTYGNQKTLDELTQETMCSLSVDEGYENRKYYGATVTYNSYPNTGGFCFKIVFMKGNDIFELTHFNPWRQLGLWHQKYIIDKLNEQYHFVSILHDPLLGDSHVKP